MKTTKIVEMRTEKQHFKDLETYSELMAPVRDMTDEQRILKIAEALRLYKFARVTPGPYNNGYVLRILATSTASKLGLFYEIAAIAEYYSPKNVVIKSITRTETQIRIKRGKEYIEDPYVRAHFEMNPTKNKVYEKLAEHSESCVRWHSMSEWILTPEEHEDGPPRFYLNG